MESLEERIQRVIREDVAVVDYDPAWPAAFELEKKHLRACLPEGILGRIEHFGSTAVPGLAAKPIVDMLAEVSSLDVAKQEIVPILESQGYDYFWRPSWGDSTPPFYAWFIKRNAAGVRTHHIHMIEPDFEHWDRLLFRDYLIAHADVAREYEALKWQLARNYPSDRVAYTQGKTGFVLRVMEKARLESANLDNNRR